MADIITYDEKLKRIKKEIKRLKQIYKDIQEEHRDITAGLIQRAAYMRVELEIYEEDLALYGYVEPFTQSPNTPPYDRERPVARLYNSMNKNYQSIIKQLTDLIPKETVKPDDDGFESFVGGRGD